MHARLQARSARTGDSSIHVEIRRAVSSLGTRDPIVEQAIANVASKWPVDDPTNMRLRTNAIYGEIRRLDLETLPPAQPKRVASTPKYGPAALARRAGDTDTASPLGIC